MHQVSIASVAVLSETRHYRSVGVQVIRFVDLRLLRSWGVALVALFAGLLLMPRASEASCGDYVHVGGHAAMSDHAMPNQPTRQAADHGAPHRPCRGPGCSNGPLPAPLPAPIGLVSWEEWALVAQDLPACSDGSTHLFAEPCDLVAAGFCLSILRPPR